jgi:hypothetical protein
MRSFLIMDGPRHIYAVIVLLVLGRSFGSWHVCKENAGRPLSYASVPLARTNKMPENSLKITSVSSYIGD